MGDEAVREACEACFDEHEHDCSGFAHAVANQFNVTLQGLANQLVDTLRSGKGWRRLPNGIAARASAQAGKLVMAGLKGSEQEHPDPHGHVVVVVDGDLAHGAYPHAYWGSLGGQPGRDETLNFAWTMNDRDNISYAEHDP